MEAYRLGLVDRLAAAGDLDDAVESVVRRPAARAARPPSVGSRACWRARESLGFARSGELTARMIAEARTQPEAQAALKAFLAKKPAPWVDGHTLDPAGGRPKGSDDPESA